MTLLTCCCQALKSDPIDLLLQALKSDPVLVTERELFTYFFTDPDRLRRTVADVEKRVQAQQVS